jgi:hypothetical protein
MMMALTRLGKTGLLVLLPLVLILLLVNGPAVGALTYYVAANGSDQAAGTQRSPWRTVNHALKTIPPDRAHRLKIGPGTFDLGGEVAVPSGLTVSGTGPTTILQGGLTIQRTKQVTISNLKLEGKQSTYKSALYVRDAERIRLHDLVIQGYQRQALSMQRVKRGKVYNATITDSSYNRRKAGGGGTHTAAITMGNLTDVDFHDLVIDTRGRGGQGISSSDDGWNSTTPWTSPSAQLTRVRFYNLDIKVDEWNSWGNGWTPQITIELWHQTCNGCEIFNSTFNSLVSLVTDNSSRVHVHHNVWDGPQNPFYACEIGSNNLEFDHNYIRNGIYPIAEFSQDGKVHDVKIHHNVFENTQSPTLVGHFLSPIQRLQFFNNTVYVTTDGPLFYFERGEAADQEIRDNIFYGVSAKLQNPLNAKVGVNNNVFFNIKSAGAKTMTFDPQLQRSGQQPAVYFRARHPRARNLGAVKSGQADWKVGKNATLVRETPD